MIKNFREWHNKKETINERTDIKDIFFREKEVWWCSLGVNVGFEQDGKGQEFRRPILILKKFNQYALLIGPLTTKIKKDNKYYVPCELDDGIERMIIISQLRLIDTKRLIDKLGVLKKESFDIIKKAIKHMI